MYICYRSYKEKLPQPNNWLKQAKIKQEPPAMDNSPLKSISPLSPAASASISSACEAEGADSQQLSTTLPVWLHQVTPGGLSFQMATSLSLPASLTAPETAWELFLWQLAEPRLLTSTEISRPACTCMQSTVREELNHVHECLWAWDWVCFHRGVINSWYQCQGYFVP